MRLKNVLAGSLAIVFALSGGTVLSASVGAYYGTGAGLTLLILAIYFTLLIDVS